MKRIWDLQKKKNVSKIVVNTLDRGGKSPLLVSSQMKKVNFHTEKKHTTVDTK